MKFYWNTDELDVPFGLCNFSTFDIEKGYPYLCVYLQSELDEYIAAKHNARVGFMMAERYIRNVIQPNLDFHGECLLAKEYP